MSSAADGMRIEIDAAADAAYVELRTGEVARTVELTPEVMVDLDRFGVVLGIETLSVDARIPFAELESKFHVHSEVIRLLELLRPNVSSFVNRVTTRAEGTLAPAVNHSERWHVGPAERAV